MGVPLVTGVNHDQIDQAKILSFADNLKIIDQQKMSMLWRTASHIRGEGVMVRSQHQIGLSKPELYTGRYEPIAPTDVKETNLWIGHKTWDSSMFLERNDLLRTMVDPTSAKIQSKIMGFGRLKDEIIIEALGGNMRTGQFSGDNLIAFDNTNVVAANSENITIDKLNTAKALLIRNQAIMGSGADEVYCVITSYQWEALMKEEKLINKDYNQLARKEQGYIINWGGIRFIVVQDDLLPKSGTTRTIYMYSKNACEVATWKDVNVRLDRAPEKRGNVFYIYMDMMLGATRTQNGRVVKIECVET